MPQIVPGTGVAWKQTAYTQYQEYFFDDADQRRLPQKR